MDLADRIAAEVVTVDGRDMSLFVVMIGGTDVLATLGPDYAESRAVAYRAAIADTIRRGIWEATTTGLADLSAERLTEIEVRVAEATEGPWWPESQGSQEDWGVRCTGEAWGGFHDIGIMLERDARFVANARQDIPDLLAHIRTLERLLGDDAERLKAAERVGWEKAKAACVIAVNKAYGGPTHWQPGREMILKAVGGVTP